MSVLSNVEKFDDCWLGPPALNLCWRILKLPDQLTGGLLQAGRDPLKLRVLLTRTGCTSFPGRLTFVPRRGSAVVPYFLYFTVGDKVFIVFCACFLGDGMPLHLSFSFQETKHSSTLRSCPKDMQLDRRVFTGRLN